MHSLSLLLGAAAGVNAMLGGKIDAVVLPGNQFICANDCVHKRVFFGTRATCLENETVLLLDENGQLSVPGFPLEFLCREDPLLSVPGQRQRERRAGEAPEQCDLYPLTDPNEIYCESNRNPNGKLKIVQWADVEKLLEEAAAGEGSSTPQQPPGQKSREQCAREGQQAFAKCDKGFAECDRLGRAAIKSCLAGQ
ncbi:hypothetical protein BB8028_0003g16300 [Beauveria bassiana]|uniref:Uncharacterized protein n=1 Tax=Beauveria bassiana TaxID=176275 RepID=A0A2S7YA42_BEABA|nr:hypothetical protein BB8028_0003g16300 [Beauveria bassiana]